MEPQGPLVIVPNHNQEFPKKEKGSLRSLQSLFTCCRVHWHKKRPVISQNNDSQGDSGNAETHEDLADTDHTACDKVEKEHQLIAIDDRQIMLQQGYQMAVIPQQLSREENAGCSFRSPSRSSSMQPQEARAQLAPTVAALKAIDEEAGWLPLTLLQIQEQQERDATLARVRS
ncbi:hypothetical protein AAFF_G00086110 [Aldrovandia affinis]|uniref:Uncharacterized protein n=1 Tax=Aldrovandia affinis TaxID=143900 RepID=A0AAD7WC35_9TELE|nr:hypothetical protein AAFF_G00086110 [Aldrovandia affinis]